MRLHLKSKSAIVGSGPSLLSLYSYAKGSRIRVLHVCAHPGHGM